MYYSLDLKKKKNGRTSHFFILSPPPPQKKKGGGDFRFGVFFKDANNIWTLMTNFSKIERFGFQISLMGGGGGGCSPIRSAEIYT